MPPVKAHNDVVVYEDIIEHTDANFTHEAHHHQHDSEKDKNRDHHHHCSIQLLSIIAVTFEYEHTFDFFRTYVKKKVTDFYQPIYKYSYLDGIFQPPRN